MELDRFKSELQAARGRTEHLLSGISTDTNDPLSLAIAIEELARSYEELSVAEEELREQAESLYEAREEILAERQRYVNLFQFAPEAFVTTRPDGKIIEVNRAAERLLRTPQEILPKQLLTRYIPLSDRRAFRQQLLNLARSDRPLEWNLQLQLAEGPPFDAAVSVSPIRDPEGKLEAFLWLFRDLREKKQNELVRERSELMLKASRKLGAGLDQDRLMPQIGSLLVPTLADLAMLYLRGQDGKIERVEIVHRDPATARAIASAERRHSLDPDSEHPAAFVLRTGKRRFIPHIRPQTLDALNHHSSQVKWASDLKLESIICLPLRAHGRMLAIVLLARGARQRYQVRDLQLAEEMCRQIALALDQSRSNGRSRSDSETTDALASSLNKLREQALLISESVHLLKELDPDASGKWENNERQEWAGMAARGVIQNAQADVAGLLRTLDELQAIAQRESRAEPEESRSSSS